MKRLPRLLLMIGFAVALMRGPLAQAQQTDPGIKAALALLKDTAKPQRDGSHNAYLLGLRQLEDPALLPLFRGLSGSPYLSMRIHGQLGAAALSPKRRIDLTVLAEIEDQTELVQILSAAIDDELINKEAMATLLTWDGLDLPMRQAVAIRLLAAGGKVDTKPFRASLQVELNDELAVSKMLQYALAGLLLAESGDNLGKAALDKLAGIQLDAGDAVIAQALDAAMRQGFASAGGLGLTIAKDKDRDRSLRMLAIQSAMRLKTPGSAVVWRQMFLSETGTAQRIRLAMIALDAAEQVEPALFDTLEKQGEWISAIAQAGRAIASKQDDLATALKPLIATAQPISVQWVALYCQRSKPAQGPALLDEVIYPYHAPLKHHRGRIHLIKSNATTALCELYPERASEQLANRLRVDQVRPSGIGDDGEHLVRRQSMLLGIARSQSKALKPLAQSLQPDGLNDFTTEALRLFIRARHGASLTDKEWLHISDIVQGVGQLDPTMRLQLAWAYLKHKGVAKQAITATLKK